MNMYGKRCVSSENFNRQYLWPMGLSCSFEDFDKSGFETVINICPKGMSIMIDIQGFTLKLFSNTLSPVSQYFMFASCIYRMFGVNQSCLHCISTS